MGPVVEEGPESLRAAPFPGASEKFRPFTRRTGTGQHGPWRSTESVHGAITTVVNRPAAQRACTLLLLSSLVATACAAPARPDGGANSDEDSGVPNVSVRLGTGQTEYEELPPSGGRVELIYGAQGGYHLWGRARFRGFSPDVDVSFQATLTDTGQVLHMPQPARRWIADGIRRGLIDLGNGEFVTDAELVILNISCGRDLVGRSVHLQVFVRERASGRTATAARTVTVIDEVPSPDCGMTPR